MGCGASSGPALPQMPVGRAPPRRFVTVTLRATNLPPLEASGVDGYCKVLVDGKNIGKTEVVPGSRNPTWHDKFAFDVAEDSFIRIEGRLDLSADAAKAMAKEVVLGAEPYTEDLKSIGALARELPPGSYVDQKERKALLPVPALGPLVYLGLEYDTKGVDVKLYDTARPGSSDDQYLDILSPSCPKIKRKQYGAGALWQPVKPIASFPHVVYEELKLDDLSISADLSKVQLMAFKKTVAKSTGLDSVVNHHGWSGALDFDGCKRVLRDCLFDDKDEEVFMSIPDDPSAMVVVDFDNGNVDMKVVVLADTPEQRTCGYDLTIIGGARKQSAVFTPARTMCNGTLSVSRCLELEDVPFGVPFWAMQYTRWALSEQKTTTLAAVMPNLDHFE